MRKGYCSASDAQFGALVLLCREIPDEDAKKPEGWLDDEPDEVDDAGELTQQA
jgi:hypothetical protein